MIHRNCELCDKPFDAHERHLKRGHGRFCSRSCSSKSNAKTLTQVKPKGPPRRNPVVAFHDSYMPEPNSGCWLWTGRCHGYSGYGRFSLGMEQVYAHRFSLQIATAQSGEGLLALHRCDVPSCVNPDHLYWGTSADNMADMFQRQRDRTNPRRGTDHGLAKLTDDDVIAIRATSGRSALVAARYGVSSTTIKNIRRGKIWRHIP